MSLESPQYIADIKSRLQILMAEIPTVYLSEVHYHLLLTDRSLAQLMSLVYSQTFVLGYSLLA